MSLIQKARQRLAEDEDFIAPAAGEERDWLIAQLACWPERVDPNLTTNIQFLMQSAAATMLPRFELGWHVGYDHPELHRTVEAVVADPDVEGWIKLRFGDGSSSVVRPSRVRPL